MNKKLFLHGVGLSVFAAGLIGCGSKPTKPTAHTPVKTHQVNQSNTKSVAKSLPSTKVASSAKLKDSWAVSQPVKPSYKGPKKVVQRSNSNTHTREYYNRKFQNEQRRKQLQARHAANKRTIARKKTNYQVNNHQAPVSKGRAASLTGDYAGNPQTIAFIEKMSKKHGFDRSYLNYLFSNTNQTPFLKRMAYADAYGRRKSGSKPRPGSWNRYRGNFLTERTISKGIQFYRANRVAFEQAERKYGIPKEYILGIIGVETRYGGNVGKNRAIDALSAMGFNNPRRGKYFRSELESYLLMTRSARLDPLKPMASYAGALGLSQFMPSNIKRYGVDFDNSGSINLWTPKDAIGSVANYFKKHGWRKGGTVAVPAKYASSGYRTLKTGFKSKHSLSRLKNKGISANYLGNISGKASLIKLNTYSGDELWLGGHNFYVITRYNHSSHYAMAVHQLAQAINKRIGGPSDIRQATNNVDMKRAELALLEQK